MTKTKTRLGTYTNQDYDSGTGFHRNGNTVFFDHILVSKDVNKVIFCGGNVFERAEKKDTSALTWSSLMSWFFNLTMPLKLSLLLSIFVIIALAASGLAGIFTTR